MAWCFEDEASAFSDQLLNRVAQDGCVVPPLWHLEVANVLLVAERRGRVEPTQSTEFLDLLSALTIQTDLLTAQRAFPHTLPIGRQLGLSAYDSAYLELAQRTSLRLATLDSRLAAAAPQMGLGVLTCQGN